MDALLTAAFFVVFLLVGFCASYALFGLLVGMPLWPPPPVWRPSWWRGS